MTAAGGSGRTEGMRRIAAILLALPIMAVGGISAHWVAYELAVPDASARSTLLAATGHAYGARLPAIAGVLVAMMLIGLGALVFGRGSALERLRIGPSSFVALPLLGFVVQEHAERLAAGYGSTWHVWQEPTFWRGLLLQVPFGLLAYAVATLLHRGARALHAVVGARRRRCLRVTTESTTVVVAYRSLLLRRVRCGDALRFRGPPAGLRCCL